MHALATGFSDSLKLNNLRYFFYAILIFIVIAILIQQSLYGLLSDYLITLDSQDSWLSWAASLALHALLGVLGYFLIAPIVLMIVSLFSENIVNNIRQSRYPQLPVSQGAGGMESVMTTGTILGKYFLVMLLTSPLMLLGIGYVLFFVLGFLLFRKLLLLDILGLRMPLQEIQQQSPTRYWWTTGILYLFTLIPGVNLFIPYLAVCVLSNEAMKQEISHINQ
jgi:uncharacterized protein involved in cysteine biosynthesis